MDLGQSIALFLGLAIGLLILFCLVTKFFQYRMNKRIKQQGQLYSQVDDINDPDIQDTQNYYQQYVEKRRQQKQLTINIKTPKNSEQQKAFEFQMTQIQTPLSHSIDPIYGVSNLRRKLDGQVLPMKPQTNRTAASLRSFRPQKLKSNLSLPTDRSSQGSVMVRSQDPLVAYEFLSKLVCYSEQGIQIVDTNLVSIKKMGGVIIERKTPKTHIIGSLDDGLESHLEVFGFQQQSYGCIKFLSKVEVPHMVPSHEYYLQNLKISQSNKQDIEFSEFYKLKDKIETP